MSEEIHVRVNDVLKDILRRVQEGLQDALEIRPVWAADVADELKQVAEVMSEVMVLAKSASTAVAMDGVKVAIDALPKEAASLKTIAQVRTVLLELTSNIERLEATTTSEVAAVRARLEGLLDRLPGIEQAQQELLDRLDNISAHMKALEEMTSQNQQILTVISRPWYRRIFS